MKIQEQANILIKNALVLAEDTSCAKVFLFLNSEQACKALSDIDSVKDEKIVIILPKDQKIPVISG